MIVTYSRQTQNSAPLHAPATLRPRPGGHAPATLRPRSGHAPATPWPLPQVPQLLLWIEGCVPSSTSATVCGSTALPLETQGDGNLSRSRGPHGPVRHRALSTEITDCGGVDSPTRSVAGQAEALSSASSSLTSTELKKHAQQSSGLEGLDGYRGHSESAGDIDPSSGRTGVSPFEGVPGRRPRARSAGGGGQMEGGVRGGAEGGLELDGLAGLVRGAWALHDLKEMAAAYVTMA